jgi:glutathione S-transferase
LLDSAESWAAFKALWPISKMPLLRDSDRNTLVPEATIIIEYLDQHYRGRTRFIPDDADAARDVRLKDRLFDLYLQTPMQRITTELLSPERSNNAIAQAKEHLRTAYGVLEQQFEGPFANGGAFSMADCAALPALFYGDMRTPIADFPKLTAYLERLKQRPSIARVLKEAAPYLQHVPKELT